MSAAAGREPGPEDLAPLVAAELARPVDPRIGAMAAAIAARYPGAARAVLFYGSCLWADAAALDGQMLDFYLIVSDYAAAYGKGWFAFANRLLPPNVFPFQHGGLAAKYAVLSEADFARECGLDARSVSVWARFAQPSRLAWVADSPAGELVVAAVAEAPPTLFQLTLPMLEPGAAADVSAIWKAGFALTYAAELRAERTNRSASIVDADPDRYDRFGHATLAVVAQRMAVGPNGEMPNRTAPATMRVRWRVIQRRGKRLSVLRLAKASTTFAGGIDYLAWKINRHAGAGIVLTPWQRRFPLLGALTLLPRLIGRGAIR